MKVLIPVLIAATLLTPKAANAAEWKGHTDRWHGACQGWQMGETLLTPNEWRTRNGAAKIRRLVVCVFDRWAPGNAPYAVYVANRESHFYSWAQNPSSLCSGLFQHVLSAWASRAMSYLRRQQFKHWPARWWDPRANAIVAAKMVASGGWGPWGG